MCGIIGIHYFDPARKVTTEELVSMADHIIPQLNPLPHRGRVRVGGMINTLIKIRTPH